jgi:hypothetical protein
MKIWLKIACSAVLWAASAQAQGGRFSEYADAPLPGPDDPVLAGYDLVEYHNLEPDETGVLGSAAYSVRLDNNYLYYFKNEANREAFLADPEKYLPAYGGFCAWGIAWEYPAGACLLVVFEEEGFASRDA